MPGVFPLYAQDCSQIMCRHSRCCGAERPHEPKVAGEKRCQVLSYSGARLRGTGMALLLGLTSQVGWILNPEPACCWHAFGPMLDLRLPGEKLHWASMPILSLTECAA